MKSAIALFLFLAFLPAGCAPRLPDPAPEGDRIVSLAPNLTEIVCAVGAGGALVGRTSVCDYPPEIVKSVPVIGGFGAPSMDRLLKTRPTLILDVALEDETVANLMTQLGVRRVRVPCATLDDIPTAVLTVGRLAHVESTAQPLAERIRREVSERRDALEKRKASGQTTPTVFVEIWGDPLMTVGRNSFVAELVALAGGRNLGDEVTDKDYFPVSSEWVIVRNPDIILCLYMEANSGQRSAVSGQRFEIGEQMPDDGLPTVAPGAKAGRQPAHRRVRRSLGEDGSLGEGGTTDDGRRTTNNGQQKSAIRNPQSAIRNQIAARTSWAQIKAVREGRVYGGFDNNLILRPGPRVLEGIEALQACIQPKKSSSIRMDTDRQRLFVSVHATLTRLQRYAQHCGQELETRN